MRKNSYLIMSVAAVTALTSCKKLGDLSADNFTVTPTPLEAVAGQVSTTIDGKFPEKYMKKKAVVTVTPVLKYEGGEAKGQSATFQGEKVEGNDQTIAYKAGGTYTMKAIFDYVPAMQKSDLYLQFDAKVGKKTVSVPEVKVGYGVLATSALLGKTLASTNPSLAPDAYQRIIKEKQEANIKFLIQQANLRSSELNSTSMKDFVKMLKQINDEKETKALKNIEVSAYASPDGALDLNTRLAEKRQDNSEKYLQKQLKSNKMTAEVDTKYTAEDWDGFQELVSQSNIQDKEVILRVLSMYKDPEEREKQIRNMSAVFKELADQILPELRRARLTINYEIIGRSDEQIVAQYKSDASQLSVEEMLYGANLMTNAADKEAWYQKTTQLYANDYRAYNNLGINRSLEYRAFQRKTFAQLCRVGKVAVMCQRQVATIKINAQRLNIVRHAGAGSGITHMPDGDMPFQTAYAAFKNIGHKAHALAYFHVRTVGSGNAAAFLTAVLQCVQPPVGVQRNIVAVGINTEHAALFVHFVIRKINARHSLLLFRRQITVQKRGAQPVFRLWP